MIYPNLHIRWAAAHLGEDTLRGFALELVVEAFNDLLWLQYPKLMDAKSPARATTCLSHSTLPRIWLEWSVIINVKIDYDGLGENGWRK